MVGSMPDAQGRSGLAAAARTARTPLRAAAALVAVEGLTMIGLGALLLVRGFGADVDDVWRAELGAALALASGGGVVLLARALLTGRRRVQSPVVVTQLLCLPVAVGLVQGGLYGYGVPLLAVPIAVLILLGVSGVYR
jgi:hypothetical protein